jgi:hypothetical protein
MLKRSDLPPLAFTVEPSGRVHLLIDGRARLHIGTASILAARPDEGLGAPAVLEVCLPIMDPVVKYVSWDALSEISAAEEAARAA